MSELTKYKFWGVLIVVLISIYTLVPSLIGLKARKADLVRAGKEIPWFLKILPSAELNLGLDLRGGMYVELGVDLAKAREREKNILVAEIARVSTGEEDKETFIKAVGSDLVRVETKAEKLNDVLVKIRKGYQMYLEDITTVREVFFTIKGDAEPAKKAVQKAIDESGRTVVFSTAQNGKAIGILFSSVDDKQWVSTTFAGENYQDQLEPIEAVSGVAYFKIKEEYFKSVQADILQQAANAIRNRIDRFGVAEASVSIQAGERIIVEVPGVKQGADGNVNAEVARVLDVVKQTGELGFHLVDTTKSLEEVYAIVSEKITSLELLKKSGIEDEDLSKLNAEKLKTLFTQDNIDAINKAAKADLPEGSSIYVEFLRDETTDAVTGFRPYLLFDKADITGEMIESSSTDRDRGEWVVTMAFNPMGTQIFGDVTSKNVGKLFAIVLDGRVMLAPQIKDAIPGGSAQIELGFGEESHNEAKKISLILKEGALPARLSIESQSLIGPSLGQDAIDAGINSVLLAAIVVVLFMLVYYKVGGLIANIALALNVIMIFSIMSWFGASLSLPGIAGIVLTMGMAVDANVIIFERMREEKHRARSAAEVIHSGYSNAMSAIMDGNITTLLSGLVLFQFGTGPIKGFATTLMIGIVTTLFTAVVVTQVTYEVLLEKFGMRKVSC